MTKTGKVPYLLFAAFVVLPFAYGLWLDQRQPTSGLDGYLIVLVAYLVVGVPVYLAMLMHVAWRIGRQLTRRFILGVCLLATTIAAFLVAGEPIQQTFWLGVVWLTMVAVSYLLMKTDLDYLAMHMPEAATSRAKS